MSYKMLGDYIQPVNIRNTELKVETLLGVSIKKILMPSIANTIGTNMKNYKIIRKNQFAYGPVTSRNGDKISIALLEEHNEAIVSQAYTVFEVDDDDKLLPEYLMMWFRRPEFDRYARFKSHGSARETFDWDELCEVTLPIPSIEQQQQIVDEYNTVTNRIQLNEQINQNLEATAQALYKHWFVDFEFPIDLCQSELVEDPNCHLEHVTSSAVERREVSLETLNKIDFTKGYKSSGGKMVYNEELDKEIPLGWESGCLGGLIETINGFAFKSSDFSTEGTYPILKIKNVEPPLISLEDTQFYDDVLTERLERVLIKKEDILITMTGSGANQINSAVGQVGRYYFNSPSLLNQRVCKILVKAFEVKEFVYLLLSNEKTHMELLAGSSGSANQANISPDQIKNLKIVLPNEKVLLDFESKVSILFNSKRVEQQDYLHKLKDLILSKMSKVNTKTVLV